MYLPSLPGSADTAGWNLALELDTRPLVNLKDETYEELKRHIAESKNEDVRENTKEEIF